MSNFIIVNGELYHHGVKGQRWGVRRYQNKDGSLTKAGKRRKAKEDYENEIEGRRKALNARADKLYDQSIEGKWKKKHPNADPDDFGDKVAGNPNFKDPKFDQSDRLRSRASTLDKSYAKNQAIGAAVVT